MTLSIGVERRDGDGSHGHEDSSGTLLYLTKQLERSVRARLEEVTSTEGLTSLQYTALTVLERTPGLTSAKLARNSFVRAQTMAQMVTSLEDRGLIERSRDSTNKRQYLISLTLEGWEVLDRLRDPVACVERRMLSGLGEDEVEAFRHALHHCRHALSDGAPS